MKTPLREDKQLWKTAIPQGYPRTMGELTVFEDEIPMKLEEISKIDRGHIWKRTGINFQAFDKHDGFLVISCEVRAQRGDVFIVEEEIEFGPEHPLSVKLLCYDGKEFSLNKDYIYFGL